MQNDQARRAEEVGIQRIAGTPADVFISYSHRDRPLANQLHEALTSRGLNVWYDDDGDSLIVGLGWKIPIERAIGEVGHFVPLLTPTIAQEKDQAHGWRDEWNLALERLHQMPEDRPFILPVCTAGFDIVADAPDFKDLHAITNATEADMGRVADKIADIVGQYKAVQRREAKRNELMHASTGWFAAAFLAVGLGALCFDGNILHNWPMLCAALVCFALCLVLNLHHLALRDESPAYKWGALLCSVAMAWLWEVLLSTHHQCIGDVRLHIFDHSLCLSNISTWVAFAFVAVGAALCCKAELLPSRSQCSFRQACLSLLHPAGWHPEMVRMLKAMGLFCLLLFILMAGTVSTTPLQLVVLVALAPILLASLALWDGELLRSRAAWWWTVGAAAALAGLWGTLHCPLRPLTWLVGLLLTLPVWACVGLTRGMANRPVARLLRTAIAWGVGFVALPCLVMGYPIWGFPGYSLVCNGHVKHCRPTMLWAGYVVMENDAGKQGAFDHLGRPLLPVAFDHISPQAKMFRSATVHFAGNEYLDDFDARYWALGFLVNEGQYVYIHDHRDLDNHFTAQLNAQFNTRLKGNIATEDVFQKNMMGLPSGAINGHDYVDLGLSVVWATENIGADNGSHGMAFYVFGGDYFAWGETEAKMWYTLKNSTSYGNHSVPDCIAGNAQYDAARALWGAPWRMPTKAEMVELLKRAAWQRNDSVSINRKKAAAIYVGTYGDKAINLPAMGYRTNQAGFLGHIGEGTAAWYWTATGAEKDDKHRRARAIQLQFEGERRLYWEEDFLGEEYRYEGLPIRPVADRPAAGTP